MRSVRESRNFSRTALVALCTLAGVAVACASACKPRTFNSHKVASAGASSVGRNWYKHPTSEMYSVKNPRNIEAAAGVADAFIAKHSPDASGKVDDAPDAAERLSTAHQSDLLKIFNPEYAALLAHIEKTAKVTLPDANVRAILKCGIVDTDKGKLNTYKSLLKSQTDVDPGKSDLLFDTLRGIPGRGNETAKSIISEYLASSKLQGWILNPNKNITNDELRGWFDKKPILANWMHELPGIADSIVLLQNGAIQPVEFREMLAISLFHNGPNAGYWNKVTDVFLPDDAFGAGSNAIQSLFTDTVYEKEKFAQQSGPKKKVSYPAPTTYLSLFHVVLDRLSQGTKGGVHKIWHEIKPFTKPAKMADELLVVNQAATLEQLKALKAHVEGLRSDTAAPGRLVAPQVESLVAIIDAASTRIEKLQAYLALNAKIEPGKASLKVNGKDMNFTDTTPASEALPAVLALLEAEESTSNGEAFAGAFEIASRQLGLVRN